MPLLRELQAAVGEALLGGPTEAAAAQILEDGLRPQARLDVYRHHVFTTLTAALQATYPVVCRLVHERFFGYAADQYIRADPPAGPCLFEYGSSFPAFLADFEPCRHLQYLPDVARLEWALNTATHAEQSAALDPVVLSQLPVEDLPGLTLRLDPSLSLLRSPWPIDQIWRVNQPEGGPDATVDLGSGGVSLEVRQMGDHAVFRPLDRAIYAFRGALRRGDCLAEAADVALETNGAFDLSQALRNLFAEQLPVDYEVSSKGPEHG
jgi:hypothetical protein